ncbi:variant erythrocyte surface antigen-1 family protein [Babesia caballi]|uniref:Variant erythrocyte surface antigen-1 family protein n=1 Tax=Babesia caballi TaxID=5871 RepID=A0AAV4LN29_BABCB|nr:variant erythrocyte surface antigen-1 family protein [Babesia caballi]
MSAGTKSLTDCPSNLKEAIDWILRVTGKDGQSGGQNASQELAKAVTQLLEGVKDINSKITIDHNLIDHLATGLAKFIGYDGAGSSNNIGNGGIAVGKGGGTNQPPLDAGDNSSTKGYKLTYDSSATWQKQVESGGDAEANKTICAKIFLGCVPMIFSALSYLYWRCDKKGNGEWRGMQFSGANKIYELKNFMVGMGYKASELSGNIGQTIVQSVTKDTFEDFKEGIQLAKQAATERAKKENEVKKKIYRGTSSQSSSTSAKPTYTEFLKQLCEQRSVGPLFTQSNDYALQCSRVKTQAPLHDSRNALLFSCAPLLTSLRQT